MSFSVTEPGHVGILLSVDQLAAYKTDHVKRFPFTRLRHKSKFVFYDHGVDAGYTGITFKSNFLSIPDKIGFVEYSHNDWRIGSDQRRIKCTLGVSRALIKDS